MHISFEISVILLIILMEKKIVLYIQPDVQGLAKMVLRLPSFTFTHFSKMLNSEMVYSFRNQYLSTFKAKLSMIIFEYGKSDLNITIIRRLD